MQRHPMTPQGKVKLEQELARLKQVERPAIVEAIEEARAHGDLSENAEYHAAKEKQGLNEAKIRDIESRLAMSQVVDPSNLSGNRVTFGATVTVLELATDEEHTYSIVGEHESDFKKGRISYKSPIARGLLGREEGDEAVVAAQRGERRFEILEVEFKAIPLD